MPVLQLLCNTSGLQKSAHNIRKPLVSHLYIVMGTHCDCGSLFCRYDVHVYSGSDLI